MCAAHDGSRGGVDTGPLGEYLRESVIHAAGDCLVLTVAEWRQLAAAAACLGVYAVKAFPFTDYISAGVVELPSDNPLMEQLGIDADVQLSGISIMPDFESELRLEITGGNVTGGILARLANILVTISESNDSYNRLRREVREAKYGADDDYDTDTVAVDTVVAYAE